MYTSQATLAVQPPCSPPAGPCSTLIEICLAVTARYLEEGRIPGACEHGPGQVWPATTAHRHRRTAGEESFAHI